ncbi:hypothetical protein [Bradyrhizobium sp.]|uniref:hypothetical protein n=1 Tax=Bradyrhizobium sp. TaxID=376 RepID=UPI002D417C88|nr:hypothetical protein [Bradyrhizobium sp.]HZR76760.1 hypothetical protein [Bradyrhizobium sp.]
MEDLELYLVDIVDPTFKDFEEHPTSRRHAFLACVVTCHAVDYLAYPNDPRSLRQQFEHQSEAFKIVNDVGHAFKHVVQGRPSAPRMMQSDVIERPPFYWGIGVWGLSRWGDEVGGVTLDSDRTVDLLETVRTAVAFLWSKVEASRRQLDEPPLIG